MLTVGSGPDSQCGPEQVCSFWGSVSPTCEMGPSVRTSQGCGQEGWRRGQCSRGRHQVAGSSLPGPRVHAAPARYERALGSRRPPWYAPHPPQPRWPREAPEAGPPRPPLPPRPRPPPPAGAPPAFRRGCGSRKRRARRSALPRPDAPRATRSTQPDHPAGPSGGSGVIGPGSEPRTSPTDGAGGADSSPGGHGDPGPASGRGPAGAPSLRSRRRGQREP